MIDLQNESLIPVREVPSHLPTSTAGQKVHVATVWRWIKRGCRGVKLETLLLGGSRLTSLEALQRFAERTTAAADGATESGAETVAVHRRSHEQASRELDEAGI